jgi:flavin reductase (DIM6/NTAB) family NADH-FMN oxidoreductase RutF
VDRSRLELPVAEMRRGQAYRWLTATVIPRPIAWVSSRSGAGVDNLAPHSFFTVASAQPPVVSFTSVGSKDTLRNVRETGEFVVCLAPRGLAEQVNLTGTDFPPGTSEFEAVGLVREPSSAVAPPRVADSPVALECRAAGEHSFGDSTVVFGEVVHLAVARWALAEDGLPDAAALGPASRLGRDEWGALGELFDLRRVPYTRWAGEEPPAR